MPTIAIIAGVRIVIYPKDHLPPHIHAILGDQEAQFSIVTSDLLEGSLPPAKRGAVGARIDANRERIAYVWEEIRALRYSGGRIDE